MLALIAFLPILATLVLMMVFNWPAKWSLMVSWVMAFVFGVLFFDVDLGALAAGSGYGMLSAIEVIIIITGAILVMNTLKASGATAAINRGFMNICPDKRVQACIIGFSFCSFIEAAAGFGTPAALAGPLLVSLGFPPMAAAMATLIFDSTAVSFGAVGTPVSTGLAMLGMGGDAQFVADFGFWTAVPHAVMGTFLPLLVLMMTTKLFSHEKSVKPALEAAPFAIFSGLSFTVPFLLIARFIGYEFASLLGALISIAVSVIAAKKGFLVPKKTWDFGPEEKWDDSWRATRLVSPVAESDMPLLKAWVPYVLIAAILVITRIPQLGLKGLLTSGLPFVVGIQNLFGFENLDWTLKWAYTPGVVFIVVALLTNVMHKMSAEKIKQSWKDTINQVTGAAIALLFGLALVEVMKYKNAEGVSMMVAMANALTKLGDSLYMVIAPFIGVLGSFVSGSATVSMTLFTNLQYETATALDLPAVLIVAMQCIGGAVGNMVCINNSVAACATIGTTGREGKLIKTNALPMVIYTLVTVAVIWLAMTLGWY
ncbi:MAG: L-lactate permease [Oscillospiraceae bacterium]|nr:L-lactate permease [Oscillospiraceae bacterium]